MPTFPKAKVERLKDAKPGALLSLRRGNGQVMFGFRVAVSGERDDPEEPAFVELARRSGDGFDANLIPTRGDLGWCVNGDATVVNHSDAWTIHVDSKDWDPDLRFRSFEFSESGLLLLGKEDQRGLAVGDVGGCLYLNFRTWQAERPPAGGKYISARLWNLSLPAAKNDVDWPLGEIGPIRGNPSAGA
jgi:hypothetical protein